MWWLFASPVSGYVFWCTSDLMEYSLEFTENKSLDTATTSRKASHDASNLKVDELQGLLIITKTRNMRALHEAGFIWWSNQGGIRFSLHESIQFDSKSTLNLIVEKTSHIRVVNSVRCCLGKKKEKLGTTKTCTTCLRLYLKKKCSFGSSLPRRNDHLIPQVMNSTAAPGARTELQRWQKYPSSVTFFFFFL